MQRGGPVAFKEQKRAITVELDRGNFSVRITREKEILLLLSSPTSLEEEECKRMTRGDAFESPRFESG